MVAQDSIPPKKKVDSIVIPTIPPKRKLDSVIIDTMAIDTMIVDTLVIRRKQERIKNFQKDIVTLNTTICF